jgi:hypothetical protein
MRLDLRQATILSDRYLDVLWGEKGNVAVLLLQAPIIGGLCALVWGAAGEGTPSLYFVLSLTAVWLGCINACREIVKERAILDRERLTGLSVGAYLYSKFKVQSILNVAQVMVLLALVEHFVHPRGHIGWQAVVLFMASEAGTALGLLTSAIATKQDRAVFAVPILVLPQILLSEFALPREAFGEVMRMGEKLMPVHWAFEALRENAKPDGSWLHAAGFSLVLLFIIPLLLVAAWAVLRLQKPRI